MMLKSTIKVPAQGIFGYGPDIVDAIANQMRGMHYLAQSKMHWLRNHNLNIGECYRCSAYPWKAEARLAWLRMRKLLMHPRHQKSA